MMEEYKQIAEKEENAFYITFNKGDIYIPVQLKNKAIGVDGDLCQILPQIATSLKKLSL